MRTLDELLGEHPFFKGLPPALLAYVAGCGRNVMFDAGSFIAREGDDANLFYIVRHGRVDLEIEAPGRGAIVIESLGEGDVLGWSWLVPPHRWRFDVRAAELTRAVALDGACLREKCEGDPALGYAVLKRLVQVVADRLQCARMQLLDLYGARK